MFLYLDRWLLVDKNYILQLRVADSEVRIMKYRVENSVYVDFDQSADAALTESLRRHGSVDIDMLDDEEVKLCSIVVSVHDVHCGSASGELRSQEN